MRVLFALLLIVLTLADLKVSGATAQEIKPIARKLPPPGVEIPAEDLDRLRGKADALAKAIDKTKPVSEEHQILLPDVKIYLKAVQYALDNGEFFDRRDVAKAEQLLARGSERLQTLAGGKASWRDQRGTLVRGFRSGLDNSVQPYGLVIPDKLDLDGNKKVPLYVWLHGRGDKMTDLSFIVGREGKPGEIHPDNAIVLHPFGRYCNGFKFAGEVDVLEAIKTVQANYPIDSERIVLCGFSMGGAGAWHFGTHYAEHWCAVSPGAGFAETAQYQKLTPEQYPSWYEQKLWGLYDVPDYVWNLFNIPVVAYSGELDKQIQSARVMEAAYRREGRELPHLIGPGVAHKYNPETLAELMKRLDGFAAAGRPQNPQQITIETRTLRYNSYGPLKILGLGKHWVDGRAEFDANDLKFTTRNVTALEITLPLATDAPHHLRVDGQDIASAGGSQPTLLERRGDRWQCVNEFPPSGGLRKVHGLQGPIDDAFMEPFLVVTPTGQSASPQVERWVQFELAHFLDRWKRLFRGTPRMKKDTEVTDQDLKNYHLIVWGDPQSNKVLARAASKLPIAWTPEQFTAGKQQFATPGHALVMIYPNPLQPSRYLVINSGPTYREGHDASNSVQTPKLPDWAVIDLSAPPDGLAPGRVAAADFFDESWAFSPGEPQK